MSEYSYHCAPVPPSQPAMASLALRCWLSYPRDGQPTGEIPQVHRLSSSNFWSGSPNANNSNNAWNVNFNNGNANNNNRSYGYSVRLVRGGE